MSRKERQRKVILEQVINGHLRREDGAKRLQIGGRQLKRLLYRARSQSEVLTT